MADQQRDDAGSAFVLVVDDSTDNAAVARQILALGGFDVEVALSGAAALDVMERRPPDVIVLDVMMPEMGGLQVLDRIRGDRRRAHIPVILVTAKAQDADLLAGYRFGADYYIPKPYTARELLYGIRLVLGREARGGGRSGPSDGP